MSRPFVLANGRGFHVSPPPRNSRSYSSSRSARAGSRHDDRRRRTCVRADSGWRNSLRMTTSSRMFSTATAVSVAERRTLAAPVVRSIARSSVVNLPAAKRRSDRTATFRSAIALMPQPGVYGATSRVSQSGARTSRVPSGRRSNAATARAADALGTASVAAGEAGRVDEGSFRGDGDGGATDVEVHPARRMARRSARFS